MRERGGRSVAVLIVSALGLATYWQTIHRHSHWPWYALSAAFVVGVVATGVGHKIMKKHPVGAVLLFMLLPLATCATGSTFVFLAIRAVVVVLQHLDHLARPEKDTLREAITALVTGTVGWIVLDRLADPASWLWPTKHVRRAFERSFRRTWKQGTPPVDSIYSRRVPGAHPIIEGWRAPATVRRAREIARALADPATAKFEPVTGPVANTPPGKHEAHP